MYIHQHTDWTDFRWNNDELLPLMGRVRYLQGRLLGQMALGFPFAGRGRADHFDARCTEIFRDRRGVAQSRTGSLVHCPTTRSGGCRAGAFPASCGRRCRDDARRHTAIRYAIDERTSFRMAQRAVSDRIQRIVQNRGCKISQR